MYEAFSIELLLGNEKFGPWVSSLVKTPLEREG